jgi:hypothetical protein
MYFFQVQRITLVPGVRRVGFIVNAVTHVFPRTKEMTQKILCGQFATEKMIVVAPYMVSFHRDLRNVLIITRQIIQHLMRRTAH